MGMFDIGKKVRKKSLRVGAKVRHTARKTTLGHTAPTFGEKTERTFAGTKLSPKSRTMIQKEKVKRARKTKKQIKRIWRKLI